MSLAGLGCSELLDCDLFLVAGWPARQAAGQTASKILHHNTEQATDKVLHLKSNVRLVNAKQGRLLAFKLNAH